MPFVMPIEFLTSALVTLIVVLEPIGLVPSFLALTQGMSDATKRSVAVRACLIAFGILAGTALVGDWLLRMLAISLPAFRIAGGLLLFSIASEMVFGTRNVRKSQQAIEAVEERARDVAAFPLAIPLMAGPGAITATALLSGRTEGNVILLAELLGVVAIVVLACFVVFLLAPVIGRLIGTTANAVLSRLLGVLLAALAVQFVIDGVRHAMAA
jgi:multiple antibiotic resistance protein